MSRFVSLTHYKSRKNHRCCACFHIIPKGFSYIKSFDAYYGDVLSLKWHTECREEFDRILNQNNDEEMNARDTWDDDLPDEIKSKYGVEVSK